MREKRRPGRPSGEATKPLRVRVADINAMRKLAARHNVKTLTDSELIANAVKFYVTLFDPDSEFIPMRESRLAEILVAHTVEMMGKMAESLGHDVKIVGKPVKPISYHVERLDAASDEDNKQLMIEPDEARPWSVVH